MYHLFNICDHGADTLIPIISGPNGVFCFHSTNSRSLRKQIVKFAFRNSETSKESIQYTAPLLVLFAKYTTEYQRTALHSCFVRLKHWKWDWNFRKDFSSHSLSPPFGMKTFLVQDDKFLNYKFLIELSSTLKRFCKLCPIVLKLWSFVIIQMIQHV